MPQANIPVYRVGGRVRGKKGLSETTQVTVNKGQGVLLEAQNLHL